jgi:hypothetical protein
MGVAFSIAPAAPPAKRVKRLWVISILSIGNQMSKNERELGVRSVLDQTCFKVAVWPKAILPIDSVSIFKS